MSKPNKTNITVSSSGNILPPVKEANQYCNARLRFQDGYCTKQAGVGTEHVGTGRCSLHGGKSSGRPKKQFSASEIVSKETTVFNTDILKKIEEISDGDATSVANIDNEINVLRSVFYQYMQKCYTDKRMPHPGDLKKFTDCLAKMLEVKSKLDSKGTPKSISINVFNIMVTKITTILKKHISDADLLNKIAGDMERLSLPEPDDESK